ncbi:MAG: acyltransferase domain-containing protein [Clostridia bacterium]|nr:acyltransferase domain-containing protein [Clostridia bacterium]
MDYEMLDYINIDNRLLDEIRNLSPKDNAKVLRLSKSYAKGKTLRLAKQNDIIKLATALKAAEKTLRLYRRHGIDDKIFCDTMDDIRIWCDNCGNNGLNNIGWIKNHINFSLFKIGRLQFQLFRYRGKITPAPLPLSCGEKSVYIHIPQGEKLSQAECVASIQAADKFFAKYFPKHSYEYYFCESWLLYQGNRDYMLKTSNIVKFMDLFDIAYSTKDERQALERIYGLGSKEISAIFSAKGDSRLSAIEELPENTSLQRAAKQYMADGNLLGVGIGTIKRNTL